MSRGLPTLTPKKVISALERGNFFIHLTVAFHRKDIKLGALRSIIKQAGLTVDEFIDLL